NASRPDWKRRRREKTSLHPVWSELVESAADVGRPRNRCVLLAASAPPGEIRQGCAGHDRHPSRVRLWNGSNAAAGGWECGLPDDKVGAVDIAVAVRVPHRQRGFAGIVG